MDRLRKAKDSCLQFLGVKHLGKGQRAHTTGQLNEIAEEGGALYQGTAVQRRGGKQRKGGPARSCQDRHSVSAFPQIVVEDWQPPVMLHAFQINRFITRNSDTGNLIDINVNQMFYGRFVGWGLIQIL